MNKTNFRSIIVLFILVSILAACTSTATPQVVAETAAVPTAPPTTAPTQPISTEEPTVPPPLSPTLEPVKLKVLVLPYLAYAPYFIAQEEGLFAEQNLEVEFVRMDKSGESTPALAHGELDVAADLLSVGTLNAIAQGSHIKLVADKGFLDPNGCTYAGWSARKDLMESGVLEDLKNVAGMKVALSVASTGEYFFDMLLKDVGLSSEDVELINASAPARMEGLMTGGLDIVSGSEPWNTRIMNAGVGDNWIGYEDIFPNFPFSIMMYGPKLLEENREVGERFMVAFLKAVKIYSEGKTDRNVEIIAKYTELDPEEVKQSCWQPIKLDGTINVQSILDFQDWAISKGYVENAITVEQFWDPEFIEYAQQQLK